MRTTGTAALQVCFIDDDPDHILIINRAIKGIDEQTAIQVFTDGAEALAFLRQSADLPDLILLDINMAGLSGFDVLAQVREDARLQQLPVIMLTSSELSADIARAYELGASGYISKPSYLHDVRAVLGNTLLYWSALKRSAARDEER